MDDWRKSSYSGGRNPDCVECRAEHPQVLIRDSRHPHLGHLAFPAAEWEAFLDAATRQEL